MNVAETMSAVAASMSAFFTPTVLFCVLNLMIGTIFITSRLRIHKRQEEHHYPQHSGQREVNTPPSPPQLLRSPSLLDRIKSFNSSSYYHRLQQPDPSHNVVKIADPHREREQAVVEEMPDVDKVMMMTAGSKSETPHSEAPAVRMKKSASEKAAPVVEEQDEEEVDRRRPATMRERKGKRTTSLGSGGEDDEAMDKKADDFINRFRQHLKLQRLDSLLRYKEMLNRGVGR